MLHTSAGLILALMLKTGKTFKEIQDFLKLVDDTIREAIDAEYEASHKRRLTRDV